MARERLPPIAVSLLRRRQRYAFAITTLAVFLWSLVVAAHLAAVPREPSSSEPTGEPTALHERQAVASRGYDIAERAALAARERANLARQTLAEFLSEHFAGHIAAAERLSQTPTAAPQPTVPSAPAPMQVTDPQRHALLERQQALLARREELTTRVTPAHPEVQDIELRLAEVRDELARLAVHDEVEGPLIVNMPRPAPVAAPSNPAAPPVSDANRDEQLQQHRQAVTSFESVQYEFDLTRRELTESEAQLHAAMEECASIAAALADDTHTSVDSATAAAAGPQRLSPWAACWAAVSLSLVAGGVVAMCAAPSAPTPLTLADLVSDASAPLVGSVPDPLPAPAAIVPPFLVRLVVLGAEVSVAVFVFALIAQAVRNTGFLAQLASRPLPAILEAYHQLCASMP